MSCLRKHDEMTILDAVDSMLLLTVYAELLQQVEIPRVCADTVNLSVMACLTAANFDF